MQPQQPSRTAWGAARHRAVHQLVDNGRIFADPLAVTILGGRLDAGPDDALVHEDDTTPASRALRFFIACRSAYAEARLAEAVEQRGASQLVVLGAGFDTFAFRNPFAERLQVFEVDHPATQAWKRARLAEVGIAEPDGLTFAGCDFERETFADRLVASGFDPQRRSFVFWLGVSMYLTANAIDATLAAVAGWPGGGEIVFDYAGPLREAMSEEGRAARAALAARVAAAGEPFTEGLDPEALHARLAELGCCEIEDLGSLDLAELFLGPEVAAAARAAGAGCGGAHVLFART